MGKYLPDSKICFLTILSGIMLHCTDSAESPLESGASESVIGGELISIGVQLQAQQTGLVSDPVSVPFVLSIEQCSSGLVRLHDSVEDGFELQIYDRDTNCVAGLMEFSWKGRVWTPMGATKFYGSDLGIFENSLDEETLAVLNPFRLSNPIHKDDVVAFIFTELKSGSSIQLLHIGEPQAIPHDESLAPPNFQINDGDVQLSSIDEVTNQARLSISPSCVDVLVGNNCTDQDLLDMEGMLVQRSLSNLDHSTALSLFEEPPSGAEAIQVEEAHIIYPSEGQTGGFYLEVLTPAAFTACRSYFFIIRYLDEELNSSFTYFDLDIMSRQDTCAD